MNSHEVFIHIHQGCFAGTGAIVRLPQCQWSKPDGYGKISQCLTTTKHSKAVTVCIFLGIYCISWHYHVHYCVICHYCAVYDECKYSHTFWLADRTCLFVQYAISLSSFCKLIWRHWTYKMPVRYILLSVWVRLSIFSPLSIIQHVRLYVFSLPISVVMIERIYIPS